MPLEPVLSSTLMTAAPEGQAAKDSPERIRQAAHDFEGLLLAQMLKSARESGGGSLSGDDDESEDANSSLIELGEQQFARALSAGGGLGIAKMVVAGLTKHADR